MSGIRIQSTYRVISIIALLQFGVVIGGTLFVRAMLKANGYEDHLRDHYNSAALFVRRYSFALLLLPAVWTGLALWSERASAPCRQGRVLLIAGIAAVLFGVFYFFTVGLSTFPIPSKYTRFPA